MYLTEDGRRKFAVVESEVGISVGISRFPRAMPTMAVMWVSGPNTWRGMFKFLPTSRITLGESQVVRDHIFKKKSSTAAALPQPFLIIRPSSPDIDADVEFLELNLILFQGLDDTLEGGGNVREIGNTASNDQDLGEAHIKHIFYSLIVPM